MSDRILTPQQELFLASYTNPNSTTFGNALQSGLKAGYSQEYSESITHQLPDWLSENLGSMKMLAKAEKVLNDTLDIDHIVQAMGMFGPLFDKDTKEPVMKVDKGILAIKQDSAKFVAESIGKKRYSKKSPLTDDEGQPITVKIIQYPDGSNLAV